MRALAAFLALLVLVVVIPALLDGSEPDQFGSGNRAKETAPFTASPSPGEHRMVGLNFELVAATRVRHAKPKLKRVQRAFSWDLLAACESHGDWSTNTGNGYSGGLQMDAQFWRSYGGLEFAPAPWQASKAQQIVVAERGRAARGITPWPTCARKLGWL